MMQMIKRKRDSGFTLAELLIVVAIIGVLVAVSIPVFSSQLEKAKAAVCISSRRNVMSAYKIGCITGEYIEGTQEGVEQAIKQAGIGDAVVQSAGAANRFQVDNMCKYGGTIIITCGDNCGISLTCSKHGDAYTMEKNEGSGASEQSSGFIAEMYAWVKENGNGNFTTLKDKGAFYAEYYSKHPEEVVQMSKEYQQKLVDEGLNKTLHASDLYWWTYPITNKQGEVMYTVTYANKQSDPTLWVASDPNLRGSMTGGYVVKVNGKTYIRTNSGNTVEPGNSANKYQTADELEQALITNGYKVVS